MSKNLKKEAALSKGVKIGLGALGALGATGAGLGVAKAMQPRDIVGYTRDISQKKKTTGNFDNDADWRWTRKRPLFFGRKKHMELKDKPIRLAVVGSTPERGRAMQLLGMAREMGDRGFNGMFRAERIQKAIEKKASTQYILEGFHDELDKIGGPWGKLLQGGIKQVRTGFAKGGTEGLKAAGSAVMRTAKAGAKLGLRQAGTTYRAAQQQFQKPMPGVR